MFSQEWKLEKAFPFPKVKKDEKLGMLLAQAGNVTNVENKALQKRPVLNTGTKYIWRMECH